MAKLTDLPVELIQDIMDAAHPMPFGRLDSRYREQVPAAKTFGALRLVCHDMNNKVLQRYLECLFSVHTVMIEETSLVTLLEIAKHEHLRAALQTLFIDLRMFHFDVEFVNPHSQEDFWNPEQQRLVKNQRDFLQSFSPMLRTALGSFPNLNEISIERVTTSLDSPIPMACLGASIIQKKLGKRAELRTYNGRLICAVLSDIAHAKIGLVDLQIRFVNRAGTIPFGDYIDWENLEEETRSENFNAQYFNTVTRLSGIETVMKGLTTLSLAIRGPITDDEIQISDEELADFILENEFKYGGFRNFISLSPNLQDLTVYFATGPDPLPVNIQAAIPFKHLTKLSALELGGPQFNYQALVKSLTTLRGSLRFLTLRHVALASIDEWISFIRFLHLESELTQFEIWSPFTSKELCFRNSKGVCYQRFHSRRLRDVQPEGLGAFLADLRKRIHEVSWKCPWVSTGYIM